MTSGLECFHTLFNIRLPLGQHRINESCQLVGSGLDGAGAIHFCQTSSM